MTKEAENRAIELSSKIKEIEETLYAIKPYLNESIDVTIKKHGWSDERAFHSRLISDSPLWLAIGTALEDMKEELLKQYNELDCNYKPDKLEQTVMEKTTAWWKVWVNGGKFSFR